MPFFGNDFQNNWFRSAFGYVSFRILPCLWEGIVTIRGDKNRMPFLSHGSVIISSYKTTLNLNPSLFCCLLGP